MFLGDARDYSNFLIPDQIFSEATIEEKREFMAKKSILCKWCYYWEECPVQSSSNPFVK